MVSKRVILIGLGITLLAVILIFGLVVVAGFLSFFYIDYTYKPEPFGILEVKYTEDGKHIFYVEEWKTGIDSWSSKLFYAYPNKKNKKKLYESFSIHDLEVSPSGKHIMFTDADDLLKLIVMDPKSFKIVKKIKFSDIYPINIGWYPDSEKIYYTDKDGVYLFDIKRSKKERLIKGQYYGLVWSADGKYFIYKSERGCDERNSLFLFDYKKGTSKTLMKAWSGTFEKALIDEQKGVIFYRLDYKKDNSAEIGSINLDNLEKNLLWSRKRKYKDDPVRVEELMFAARDEGLIFYTTASDIEKDKDDGIYLLCLSDKKLNKLLTTWHVSWDYSPRTNKLIWCEINSETLKEKELVTKEGN
jgi:hypothetical protein